MAKGGGSSTVHQACPVQGEARTGKQSRRDVIWLSGGALSTRKGTGGEVGCGGGGPK